MDSLIQIHENIRRILELTDGRATVLAATKTIPAEVINEIYDMGIHVIGENRVNELMSKYDALDKRFELHFIGRLQKNKAKYIVGKVALIHSLDSEPLAAEIDKRAAALGIVQDCLVEINLGDEESKGGIALGDAEAFIASLARFGHIRVRGLMGVLPKGADSAKNIYYFTKIREKFIDIKAANVDNSSRDNIRVDILSLGMSADYREAVGCGSTLVRIGEGIFGKREALPAEK